MAKARNDAQWNHEVAMMALLGSMFSGKAGDSPDKFKPLKELDHGA